MPKHYELSPETLAYIERLVDAAPPITAEQVVALRAALSSHMPVRPAAEACSPHHSGMRASTASAADGSLEAGADSTASSVILAIPATIPAASDAARRRAVM